MAQPYNTFVETFQHIDQAAQGRLDIIEETLVFRRPVLVFGHYRRNSGISNRTPLAVPYDKMSDFCIVENK